MRMRGLCTREPSNGGKAIGSNDTLQGSGGREMKTITNRLRAARSFGRIALLACSVALTLALVGCASVRQPSSPGNGPSANRNYRTSQLSRFLLTTSDLPSGYSQTTLKRGSDRGLVAIATTRQALAQVRRLVAEGVDGYAASAFHRSAGGDNDNPGSVAFAFSSVADASRALPSVENLARSDELSTGFASGAQSTIPVAGLGDQSLHGIRFALGPYGLYLYVWRDRNVDVLLAATDVLGDLSGQSILNIAEQIDFRATR
jgi:hypothetical protein